MSKLKPCPFCGRKAHLERIGNKDCGFWWVSCDCGVLMSGKAYGVDGGDDSKKSKQELIGSWNRREKDE